MTLKQDSERARQELIEAHLEYEELAQRVQRALWRLEHAKGTQEVRHGR